MHCASGVVCMACSSPLGLPKFACRIRKHDLRLGISALCISDVHSVLLSIHAQLHIHLCTGV